MRRVRVPLLMFVLASLVGSAVQVTWSAFSTTTANPSNSFSAASSFASCLTSSPVWMTGMEHGVVSTAGGGLLGGVNTAGGTAAADSTVVRSGNYSLKVADTSGTNMVEVTTPTITGTGLATRFALRFTSLPSADVTAVVNFNLSSGNDGFVGFTKSTNKLSAGYYSGTARASSMTIAAGIWYVIDVKLDVSANPNLLDWQVNAVAQTQATRSQAASTFSNVIFGAGVGADVFTAYYDDMLITTTSADYPIGDGSIRALTPNAVGTVNDPSGRMDEDDNSAVTTGDTSWQRIDDVPLTSVTDYIKQSGSDASAYAPYDFGNVGSTGCVNAVSAVAALRSSTTSANSAKTAVWEGGTERTIFSGDMSPGTATQEYRSKFIAPATGSWDATKLSGATARLGYWNGTGGQPYWDGLMLEYDQVADAITDYSSVVNADSPVGYWRFGETSGTTATSATGSYNGTYVNSPILANGGGVGDTDTSVTLDGSTQYVSVAYNAALNTTPFTLETWAKPVAGAVEQGTVMSNFTGSKGARIYYEYTGGTWNATIGDNGASWTMVGPSAPLNTWAHLAATWDGTTFTLYVNGVNAVASPPGRIYSVNTTRPTGIGAEHTGAGFQYIFKGSIDEAAYYNTALSPARITAHYNAGKP